MPPTHGHAVAASRGGNGHSTSKSGISTWQDSCYIEERRAGVVAGSSEEGQKRRRCEKWDAGLGPCREYGGVRGGG